MMLRGCDNSRPECGLALMGIRSPMLIDTLKGGAASQSEVLRSKSPAICPEASAALRVYFWMRFDLALIFGTLGQCLLSGTPKYDSVR